MATETAPEKKDSCCTVICLFLALYWRGIFMMIWPCISMVVFLLGFEAKFRCMYVVVLMAGYWVTQCIPLYITGLIPVFLIPLLDVENTASVCINYMNPANTMFMSSLLLALGFKHSGLHRRIAFFTILKMGCSPRRLHLGLTLVTCFISMWLENSAVTALMCPIVLAVLVELEIQGIGNVYKPKGPKDADDEPPRPTNITIAYVLTTAYVGSIGGLGTIIGSATNLAYKGIYESWFPDDKIEIFPWMMFNLPPVMLMALFCWFVLEVCFMGLGRPNSAESLIIKASAANEAAAYNVMVRKVEEMGPMKWNETGVLLLFITCIGLWIFRKPQIFAGWSDLYPTTKLSDATAAIFTIIMFCVVPSTMSFCQFCTLKRSLRPKNRTVGLVPFNVLQENMDWGLIFFLGGGFALADAGKVSGMAQYLGEKLTVMSNLPTTAVLLIVCLLACMGTELTSNTALCNIIIPVVIEMSIAMGVHPLTLTYPATIMCSMSFMLPVATPGNAIAATAVNIPTTALIKAGIWLKLAGWLLWCALFPTYGTLFYKQDTILVGVSGNDTRP